MDQLVSALIDLTGVLNSPRRDTVLLREAGVSIDRALFPLLVRLGRHGALGVAELAEQAGRDHTTVSRQLARLEDLALITRCDDSADRRRRAARLTPQGETVVEAISQARRRLLERALAGWSRDDRAALAELNRRLVERLRLTED
jgi:DNA-binding MarR family transcriptional regulator